MELTFLGTGAGMPSKERNVSAIILNLLQERNSLWLFDCGEATQHQILHTKIKPRKINKIFITHLHGDHIFGLPGLLSSRSFQGGESPLTIYGPFGLKQYINTCLQISETQLQYDIHIEEITEGTIFEDDTFLVKCKQLAHNIPSYGYKIIEKDQLGQLNVDKLQSLGINPGPIYRKIKENEQIVLENGSLLHRKDFIGPSKRGKMITIFGDTTYTEEHISFAMDSDVLVHEATFEADKEQLATSYFHSTTVQAAILAKNANVQSLILTHISSRYQLEDMSMLEKEAQDIFPNSHVAFDFYTFPIK